MKIVNVVGGIGSQMMAYALHLALKKAYPSETVICDFSTYLKRNRADHNGSELKRVFGINEECVPAYLEPLIHSSRLLPRIARKSLNLAGILKNHDATYNKYNYDEAVFNQKGTVVFHQCWTSWKYFSEIEDQVRNVFNFRLLESLKNIEVMKKTMNTNSVSIHVRRGDYVGNRILGGLIGLDYYSEAISIIKEYVQDPHFFLFSDDPDWTKKNLLEKIPEPSIIINWNQKNNSYIDMQLMSSCKHHIIPNSSFSWWGAYLAKSKNQVVIAPQVWSNPSTGVELKDMNLPEWITIRNQKTF